MRRVLLGLVAACAAAVSLASQSSSLPTPESVLGFTPGDDYKLATYDESLDYFQKLDAASDRLTLVEVGRTSTGHPWYFALMSSAENLANVERYRQIAQRLAHPEGLTDDEARRLAREGGRSCTSTAACTRPRSPAASTRCSSPTTCSRTPTTRRSSRSSTTSS